MMRKKLVLLGALALTHAMLWHTPLLRADRFRDLNRAFQAFQANSSDPQVAANYIRLFDKWTEDMGNIYAEHGGGGLLGFEGGTQGWADTSFLLRGNVRVYPFFLGCWKANKFCRQPGVWLSRNFKDFGYESFLNAEQRAEIKKCCYCGAPAWKACCCDCSSNEYDLGCCFNTMMFIGTCGIWACTEWWPKKDTAKFYFKAEMGDEIVQYLYDTFRASSLREVANTLQRYFVRPIAEMLMDACDPRNAAQINFETFLRTVNLYRCYVGIDCGHLFQTGFAQYDFDNVRDRFHTWFLNVMQVPRREEDPINVFLTSTLIHWHNPIYRYVDRDSLPSTPIHPLGWYQIELLRLKSKLLEMIALRGETQHPLLVLLAVKSQELEHILEPHRGR
ncbi:MAG: hypothetical protein LBF43_03980 [Puniceicoccales bacterium]|jgi:hypothetical protein|nr:hypothetical protein [Puniceicoccales bacterium]